MAYDSRGIAIIMFLSVGTPRQPQMHLGKGRSEWLAGCARTTDDSKTAVARFYKKRHACRSSMALALRQEERSSIALKPYSGTDCYALGIPNQTPRNAAKRIVRSSRTTSMGPW